MLRKKHHRHASTHKRRVEHNGLSAYLAHYLEWMKVKGFSEETLKRKDSAIRQFIQWCDERDLNDPRAITKPMLERYQRHLYYYRKADGNALAFSTQNVFMSAIKSWFKWLTQENYTPSNPASEVMVMKRPQKLPAVVLSVEEVETILYSVDSDTLEGVRDRAILEVLYSTGIRRKELCHLQVYDLDSTHRSLFVREGKGSKDRSIPIGQRAIDWVSRYQDKVRPQLLIDGNEQTLFLTSYGEAYTSSALGHLVRRLLDQAGLNKPGGCHLFRHAMATHMLDNGAELRYIQAILGHSNINTTTVYTHLAIETLKQVHAATHPAAPANTTVSGHGDVD